MTRLLGARRAGAEAYLLITVATFAVPVVAVRWYLELTGYPKIGGGGLHVAHMLWGGLLLVVGALLPLLFVGRRSLRLSAIVTGAGMGLFIDEIGKFITESNDYFFAPAAPLIYGSVLLLVLLWVVVRRSSADASADVLQAAVEAMRAAVDGHLTVTTRDRVAARLQLVRPALPAREASLADRLMDALSTLEVGSTLVPPGWLERGETRALWERILPTRIERWLILIGLVWNVLIAALGGIILLAANEVGGLEAIDVPEGPVEVPTDPFWTLLLLGVGVLVGVVSAIAVILMLRGKGSRGSGMAILAMLISLVAAGSLTFYVTQFGALASTIAHLGLLLLILDFRIRLERA
jgi:hypothetical protein